MNTTEWVSPSSNIIAEANKIVGSTETDELIEQVQAETNWIGEKVLAIHDKAMSQDTAGETDKWLSAMSDFYSKVIDAKHSEDYNEFFANMEILKAICGHLIRTL